MQLVEHQKAKTLGRLDDGPVVGIDPGQEELEHGVVRQQDIRRVSGDPLPAPLAILVRCTAQRSRDPGPRISGLEKLFQLLHLRVAEGVHGIDDDRFDTARRWMRQRVVHDRNEIGQALARPVPVVRTYDAPVRETRTASS